MGALIHNKFIVLSIVLVALIGALAVVLTLPATETAEHTTGAQEKDLSQIAQGKHAVETASQPVQKALEQEGEEESYVASSAVPVAQSAGSSVLAFLKDVGEAAYDHFGLTREDFLAIKNAGFDVVEGNFDICASDADVKFFLDSAESAGLKVILNAGAGEAEWGYPCDGNFVPGQKPVWQKEKVRAWIGKWKNHPALYAWDTSNEDGGTFPFGTGGVEPDPDWETKYALSTWQLHEAYA
ncbi:hypothetical protein HY413_03905, partial [Candidatus Kaiserbacteria bacterium]|nr:hypothetical protein [Candidatus Kaiserbacteria bacterium]